jgi:multicomponent Na+:H+ antiporter subunit E
VSRTRRLTGQLPLLGWLTVVWVALWGSITAANVLGGLAVAVLLLVVLPLPEVATQGRVRPLALTRLLVVFAYELVKASLTVVRQVLDPRASLRQAVVAVPVVGTSDQLLTLLADAVSLTPGTLALEVDRPGAVLYVHVLDLGGADGGVEGVRRSIIRLERLILQALGPAGQVQRALAAERAAARQVSS